MPILSVFKCDICGVEQREIFPGGGAPGWGQLSGINLDGVDNPVLCSDDLARLAGAVDALKKVREVAP